MLRIFDLLISFIALILAAPIMILLFFVIFFDDGSPVFVQKRLGKNKRPFKLFKFRTMHKQVTSVATHLVEPEAVTSIGRILRKSKLDELPQLFNVLKGDMSMVGPRPGLPNQKELIVARESLGVFSVRPGITGLSQVNNIDMSTPFELAKSDAKMICSLSLKSYFLYIILTISGKGVGDKIKSWDK